MEIGKVIRRYRKEQNLTQEEMATRLGVTAPAVNKWENGNSMPDITLLGPIARLLHISVNELLSYREDLTEEEINQYMAELDEKIRTSTYEEAFQWGKALLEEYPQRKQKKAELAWKKGDKESAYKDLEELIFSEFQMLQMALQSLYLMAMEEENHEKAAYYVKKQKETAKVSEFGRYHEHAYGLEHLVQGKDADGTIAWMEDILGSVETIWDFTKSPLYEHMTFKPVNPEFAKEIIANLKNSMKDEETYGYLAGNERWERLTKES